MTDERKRNRKWSYIVVMMAIFLAAAVSVVASGSVLARPLAGGAGASLGSASLRDSRPVNTSSNRPAAIVDASAFLTPSADTSGSCAPPANGGQILLGCRWVWDLMVDAGSNVAPDGATGQQSYFTYTAGVLVNANVTNIATSCVPTSTVTTDACRLRCSPAK